MTRDTVRDTTWLGLGEASRLLGIAPETLRRWSNEGRIPVFTTPGGHRRYSRTALAGLLPAPRSRRPALARLGASPERMARAYRSQRSRPAADPWLGALSEADRSDFRDRGRLLTALILAHLDADDHETAHQLLRDGEQQAAAYGRRMADLGASLSEAVQGFLHFRSPFIDTLASIARTRGLDTREATGLLADAEAAMDRLLIAMMTGHSLATGARRHGRAATAPDGRVRG